MRVFVKIMFFCMMNSLCSSQIYSVDYNLFSVKYKKNAIYLFSIWDPKYKLPTATINPSIVDDDFSNLVRQAKELHKENYKYSLDLLYILDDNNEKFILGIKIIDSDKESLFYPYIYKYE